METKKESQQNYQSFSTSYFRNSLDADFLVVPEIGVSQNFFVEIPPCKRPDKLKYSTFRVDTVGLHPDRPTPTEFIKLQQPSPKHKLYETHGFN